MYRIATIVVSLFVSSFFAAGQDLQAKKSVALSSQVGEARVRTFRPMTYFYGTVQTDLKSLSGQINTLLPEVARAAEGRIAGTPVLIYHGNTGDPNKTFTLEVGYPVKEGTQANGNFQVKKLDAFRCVSLLYTGPTATIHEAYESLRKPGVLAAETPTDESRQMVLYWEGEESSNNVFQIMISVR